MSSGITRGHDHVRGTLLMAQEGAILHPEMKVETGTYVAPAATLGHSMEQPWSATTTAAAARNAPKPASLSAC